MKQPHDVLKEVWGYDQFRPLQEDIIRSVLAGRDTLALLPTGGGKSICFQVPALCLKGLTLVISPLIALMRDQVDNLRKRGVNAAALYSGLNRNQIDMILDNAAYGHYKLLYVSPERLQTEMFAARLEKMPVSLLAVDEAHCISQWGYDFRPPYLEIAALRTVKPAVPVIALTATATPEVVTDIREKLAFRNGEVFQQSFVRGNLTYLVRKPDSKEAALTNILKKTEGTAVVYVRSRKRTESYSRMLNQLGISADHYHAGLEPIERERKQHRWISDEVRVMVATNAFGMGIDKPDVRCVVHMDVPESPEAYFQEAGRAGRDGLPAWAVLLYQPSDAIKLREQFEQSYPPLELVRRVYGALAHKFQLAEGSQSDETFPFDLNTFCKTFGLPVMETFNALKLLQDNGWIQMTEGVYQPNTVFIEQDKESVYDFQLRHPDLDIVLRAMLRLYQGLHINDTPIRESQIARFTGLDEGVVFRRLKQLDENRIIRYQQYTSSPGIVFLMERVKPENLQFNTARLTFLKERHEFRVRTMIQYCNQPVCRSVQLLAYFGEKSSAACGQCDVCRRNKNTGAVKPEVISYWEKKIMAAVESGPVVLHKWILEQKEDHVPAILQVAGHLIDQGVLFMDGESIRKNTRSD